VSAIQSGRYRARATRGRAVGPDAYVSRRDALARHAIIKSDSASKPYVAVRYGPQPIARKPAPIGLRPSQSTATLLPAPSTPNAAFGDDQARASESSHKNRPLGVCAAFTGYRRKPDKRKGPAGPLEVMVGVRGFEPPTSASRRQRSTKLSYTPTDRSQRRARLGNSLRGVV
jgi:hypothetical protein